MLGAVTVFATSLEQVVAERTEADPRLKALWEEVSDHLRIVYAQPEAAFKALNVHAMIKNDTSARLTCDTLASNAQAYGVLRGSGTLLATPSAKRERRLAERHVPALADSLGDYLRQRRQTERYHRSEERAHRDKLAIAIPDLSPGARQVLERVRDAIERNDLPSALAFALADTMVRAELEGFARAVSLRFGEGTFLSLAARFTSGHTFQRLAADMTPPQKTELQRAWTMMRISQQLAAYQQRTEFEKQAERVRQAKTKGIALQ